MRSILLDLSEVKRKTSFQSQAFAGMSDLRYLKIYSSKCPQECDRDNKLNFPDGLQLPLSEVRCFHWLKFPLKEVPEDFNPENLVDLKLPYSEIERVWEDNKVSSIHFLSSWYNLCIRTSPSSFPFHSEIEFRIKHILIKLHFFYFWSKK